MARVTITDLSGGVPGGVYPVLCNSVTVSGKKNFDSKPNANVDGPVEVQTLSRENLQIVLNGVYMPETANNLTYNDVLFMFNQKYNGANKIFLKVEYGTIQSVTQTDSSLKTTTTTGSWDTAFSVNLSNYAVKQMSVLMKSSTVGAQYGGRFTYTYTDTTTSQQLTGDITQVGTDYQMFTYINPNPDKTVSNIKFEYATDNVANTVTATNFRYDYYIDGTTVLKGSDLYTNYDTLGIPVVLTAFSCPVSAKDSNGGYMPVGNLTFIETD